MRLAIHQFSYNDDNYGVLLHDADSGETALVDAGDANAASAALAESGWSLTQIWITHHHGDHTAGLAALADDGVDNAELIAVNEAIRSHPIEVVGKKLRSYMTAMKKVI